MVTRGQERSRCKKKTSNTPLKQIDAQKVTNHQTNSSTKPPTRRGGDKEEEDADAEIRGEADESKNQEIDTRYRCVKWETDRGRGSNREFGGLIGSTEIQIEREREAQGFYFLEGYFWGKVEHIFVIEQQWSIILGGHIKHRNSNVPF